MKAVFGEPTASYSQGVFVVDEYEYFGNKIYFASSTVGEIMASACTQYVISTFGVDLILNYGLAGGLDGAALGETLLVKGVVHYGFDTSGFDGARIGQYSIFPDAVVPTDEGMRKLILSLYPNMKEVICASADKFVSDKELKDFLVDRFGANVCEMEAAGVLFSSKNAGVPQIIMKAVSDNADDGTVFNDFLVKQNLEYISIVANVLKNI